MEQKPLTYCRRKELAWRSFVQGVGKDGFLMSLPFIPC